MIMIKLLVLNIFVKIVTSGRDLGVTDIILSNDILNPELMPTAFLEEQNTKPTDKYSEEKSINGTLFGAFNTMNFHRQMMNEYQCRNYLSEMIVNEMKGPIAGNIQRRTGQPFASGRFTPPIQTTMLMDVGSSNYKDWLNKVTSLEDVYRHMRDPSSANTTRSAGIVDNNQKLQSGELREYEVYEGQEGTVVSVPPVSAYAVNNIGNKYGGGYEYGPPPPPPPLYQGSQEHIHVIDHDPPEHVERDEHHLQVSDLFEISLTGLAFLSFGMFVLQVLMCMSMPNNVQPQVMQMVDAGSSGDTMNVDDVFRIRREAHIYTRNAKAVPDRRWAEEACRRVLIAIRAPPPTLPPAQPPAQRPRCLRVLCEDAGWARTIDGPFRYLIPLFHVGASWIEAGRAGGALARLAALALGLGGADCAAHYPCHAHNHI